MNLTDEDLGEVTLLRNDGTPLAITQFVGIWVRRATLHSGHHVIRVTGEQWRLSFAQFLAVLARLGYPDVAEDTEAVFYGMFRQPSGPIRSRDGTDLGADDLLDGVRERLVAEWAKAGVEPTPYRVETCERLALALVKLYVLSRKRLGDVTGAPDSGPPVVGVRQPSMLGRRTHHDEATPPHARADRAQAP